jgi:CDP-6-deoxy-D-xylo-4-hexulose-3-dehydrase
VDNTCRKRFGWQLGELPEGYDHKYIYSHLGYNLKPLDPQAAIGRVQLKKMPAFIEARKRNWQALRRGLVGLETVFEFSLPTHATEWRGGADSPAGSVQEGWQEATFQWEGTVRTDPSWFGFMLLVRPEAPFTRTEFAQFLDAQKIGNRMLFGGNLVRQPAFVQLRRDNPGAFRVVGETPLNGGVVEKLKGSLSSTLQPFNPSSFPLPGADQIMNQAIFIGVYPGLSAAQIDTMVRAIREFAHNTSGCRAP